MDMLSSDGDCDNFSELIETNVKSTLETMNENWSYDFNDQLFCSDDFLGNYDSSPINSFHSPYDELCIGLDSEIENISGSSSDSGLSSADNLDGDNNESLNYINSQVLKADPLKDDLVKDSSLKFLNNDSNSPKLNNPNSPKLDNPKVVVQKVPQLFSVNTKTLNSFGKNVKPIEKFNTNKEIKIVKVAPYIDTSKNKNVTIQIKKPIANGKIQTNPGTFFINKGKIAEIKKTMLNSKNTHSILIPISVKGVKEFKSVKLLTGIPKQKGNLAQPNSKLNLIENNAIEDYQDQDDQNNKMDYETDIYPEKEVKYPKLILTSEEKRLLAKEGISLPQHYPLTKNEERELKRIRRKIRNKISAQDSRKRKKDYVIGLEARVKQCTEENQNLMKRIKMLQLQNQSLVSQMKKMQNLLTKGTDKITHPTTCLMVLLMSLALITAPNLNLSKNEKELTLDEVSTSQDIAIQNRNLLSNTKSNILETFEDEKGFLLKNNLKFIDYDVDERNWYEIKTDTENNSNRNVNSNIFPSLPTTDEVHKGAVDGDILDLFSSNYIFNFDMLNGNTIDESKIDIRNQNELKSIENGVLKHLDVLSFPK